ncbi:hypothetical protein ACVII1_000187 [Bradyrhizobium elkanii]|jgi:hypothetical protein|uniref:Uncharacterized protein n=1 Tax=Bradyrhizobium elkanii TaxID=29448 RepID=A0ABV4EQU7_BRAEL|nr:hypothetical protein [Bradyrhizobium elkanii]MCP1975922.1 hypothetical protein [Bradyrhizobium elkanii]MCP1984803.1 hypothetical protein [Bradyrhizobium elkanii]MCS3695141.1 hypothetical protein [Bradyrhizobium elkanii]MCS3890840.1 hypothetical protein [Bradyrhizobium elkanii]
MPWTKITREQYRRDDLRYASDMTVSGMSSHVRGDQRA